MTAPTRPAVDAPALTARLAGGHPPRLVDVRSPAEFAAAHIAGSRNVPLDVLVEHRAEIARHLDTDVVLVCRSGQRADRAREALAGAGLPGVAVLSDGLVGWEAAGGPLARGPERRGLGGWALERQVRLVAGSLVVLGLAGSLRVPGLRWFSAAIGAGLVGAAVTDTCAMGMLLARMPWNRSGTPSRDDVIAQLSRDR